MKKLVLGVVLLSGILLSGCSGDTGTKDISKDTTSDVATELKDGKYKLEEKNYSNNYRYVLELEVKNGEISDVEFDSIDKDGNSKREDAEYIEIMKDKSGTSPDIFLDELEDSLEESKDPDKVDTVTGATHTTDSFKEYAKQLINNAKKGNSETIIIDNKVD